jgi:hypothetical protein
MENKFIITPDEESPGQKQNVNIQQVGFPDGHPL